MIIFALESPQTQLKSGIDFGLDSVQSEVSVQDAIQNAVDFYQKSKNLKTVK